MARKTLSKKIEAGLPRPAVSKYAAKHPAQISAQLANVTPLNAAIDEMFRIADLDAVCREYHFEPVKGGAILRCFICGKSYLRYDPKTVATIEVRMRDHYNVKHGGAQADKAVSHD